MKIAFIPPLGWEKYLNSSVGVQMALCIDNLMNNPWYLSAFADRRAFGDHIILDNGAAEGTQCADAVLKTMANDLKVTEIVLPDEIGSRTTTVHKVTQYLRNHVIDGMQYMAVAQGRDDFEVKRCIRSFDLMERITTIGLPRDLLKNENNHKTVRIELARWIDNMFPGRFQIHFLGTSPSWIPEVKYAAKYTNARSVDTSLPFNYGLRGIRLTQTKNTIVARPTAYLSGRIPISNASIVEENIATLREWVRGE